MLKAKDRKLVSLTACITFLMQGAWGQCPSAGAYTPSTSLTWTALDTSGNPGFYFLYYGETATEGTGDLSEYSDNFVIPGAQPGSPYGFWAQSQWGAFSYQTYPAGSASGSPWPWAVNNPNLVTYPGTDTYCTPGVNCGACVASSGGVGDYDCYGQELAKSPAIGMRSASFSASQGFNFTGSFNGGLTATSPGYMFEAAYWGESPIYLGGPEYGFYYDAIAGGVYFYDIDSYANCGASTSTSPCSTTEGGTANWDFILQGAGADPATRAR